MKYAIKNTSLLKKILWADHVLGMGTALIGLIFYPILTNFLGLTSNLIIIISIVTMVYALLAGYLAIQNQPPIRPLRVLIYGNWIWTAISAALFIKHLPEATLFGLAFLILQVVVVGMLAYLEGRHVYFNQLPKE